MTRRRLLAVAALVLVPLAVGLAVVLATDDLGQASGLFVTLSLAVIAAGYGIVRRGVGRVFAFVLAGMVVLGALVVLLDRRVADRVTVAGMFWLGVSAAYAAFTVRVPLPRAPRPRRPVLFVNPRSGDGKAERFGLAAEARKRGIEPVELRPGDDLATLVQTAANGGADGLAMAGGDGSQAIVAAIAAERGLPYACVPAGTRNHFALDLGVDRNDVVGALDAFVDGGERVVDLAEVNGRVFVNNVSLGLYASAVQRDSYRAAKLRTLLDTIPDIAGPRGRLPDLSWTAPGGESRASGTLLLISNNRYRLGPGPGSGTRPRMHGGQLGIAVVESRPDPGPRRLLRGRPWREWSAPEFEVRSADQVPAAIDGEATTIPAPLRFRTLPSALRVRIATGHPGASPSANWPDSLRHGFRTLLDIAADRDDHPAHAPTVADLTRT
jgi:Diacylglycerol kinase catalytic domain